MGKPWVQVQRRSLGESLGDKFVPKGSGGVDRATHLLGPLGSRGIVSVAFRPQRPNGYWGYALHVSVDDSSSTV
jgi:hypothetical protein